jgi:hypothetical protein
MKEERANEIARDSDPSVAGGSGNDLSSPIPQDSQSLANKRDGSAVTIEDTAERPLRVRKAGGPRTPEGKQRSKHNALKHGIFSKTVLWKEESQSEFDSLLNELLNDLQPEGGLEELLVEKLATLAWRHRRLLLAESAEIRKNMEFVESDQRDLEREEAQEIARLALREGSRGLIQKIHNPDLFERCQELLSRLRKQVERDGFNPKPDKEILRQIYGERRLNRLHENLYDSYENWLATSELPEEVRLRIGSASPENCRIRILRIIDEEILRLRRVQEAHTSVRTARTQLEIVSRNVPDGPGLDRLLRYEASLERSFDRTLSQLERVQRMRLGQPVLPKIEVRHSLS